MIRSSLARAARQGWFICLITLGAVAPWPSVAKSPQAPAKATQAPAQAQALPAGVTLVQQVEGIREYRLRNGLQVLLIPDQSKPTTTVNMTYRVGSVHENYGETGMAHLLEHLIFKGSPRHPQVWAEFNKRGLNANGSTWLDRTNYFASFAANDANLAWYLGWQADAMVNSFIARRDLDSEMTVVRNEMEMGENNPGRILLAKTLSTMYQWHNYGKSTIGARTDVEGVDIARLQAFYRQYYQPDNATLIVSGQFDAAQVLRWIARDFGVIPKPRRVLPVPYTLDSAQDGEREVTLRRVGGVPLLYAGYHTVPGAHRDHAAVELLSLILADTPSGRLHQRLTEQRLAAGVFGFTEGLRDPGFLLLGAQLAPEQDAEQARRVLLETIESFAREPITEAELTRARAKWLKDWDQGFADPQHVGVALSEAVAQGDWRLFFLTRDRVRAVTLADVQRVAQAYLLPSNRTLGRYVPTPEPQRAPAPARVDLAVAMSDFKPAAATAEVAAFDASPEHIDASTQLSTLTTGLQLALLPKPTRGQMVQGRLVLRHGTVETLAGQGEAATALAAMLDKGTTQRSRQAWQDRLDALQADVGFGAEAGQVSVAFTARRDTVSEVLTLVVEALRRPELSQAALDEVRDQALSAIAAQRKEPQHVLMEALARRDNPYPRGDVRHARSFDEQVQDWQSLTLAQVQAFHARFLSASVGQLSLVGDFEPSQARDVIKQQLGDWKGAVPQAPIPDPYVALTPGTVTLHTPDKQNATLMWQLALPINDRHPDYAALMMANHLLGSSGNSRLWNRLRETEGLSYSVYSAVDWSSRDPNTRWLASAIFAPQNRARIEQAMREELNRALVDGFSQAELDQGRAGLLSFRKLGRAQDARLAGSWVALMDLGRRFDESSKLDQALSKVTLEQVNAALRRYLKPDQMVWGWAGDFGRP
jgi:zinc protease